MKDKKGDRPHVVISGGGFGGAGGVLPCPLRSAPRVMITLIDGRTTIYSSRFFTRWQTAGLVCPREIASAHPRHSEPSEENVSVLLDEAVLH